MNLRSQRVGRYCCFCSSLSFNIGESGLGKSTMVNTLFRSKISRTSCVVGPHPIPSTTEVNSVCHGSCVHVTGNTKQKLSRAQRCSHTKTNTHTSTLDRHFAHVTHLHTRAKSDPPYLLVTLNGYLSASYTYVCHLKVITSLPLSFHSD